MRGGLNRRRLLQSSASFAALGAAGCATAPPAPLGKPSIALAPIRAEASRLFDITVCLRPFRAAGPRLDSEEVGRKLVVHNYGHGGSGWSLSWGSAHVAVGKAMQSSPKEIAVIGCGAIGLTSAIVAQQAGAQVTIYAREMLADTRSARATGSWTPDSRIALDTAVSPDFPALWEKMARISFATYRRYLGLPGNPVEWTDRYFLSGGAHDGHGPAGALPFASFRDRIVDIWPASEELPPGATPFPATSSVRRTSLMQFNIADYGHILLGDFFAAGGRFVHAEFASLGEVSRLKENVIVNCTGYGARALCRDESVVPVRGQMGWLIPQPEVNYGVYYDGVLALSRRDGIGIQMLEGGDMRGYGDPNETVDRAESEEGVRRIAALYANM
ncbi:MAG: FAD-dependent oxidoreductase [Alphaproteobacteria bacterium]|nr:FAD-dependent oxidoreductase [Alphaproteobacteria bacterium]MBV9693021.1 FAD-dependent oxidoreductase [Alphaproteobacteria bacterium]